MWTIELIVRIYITVFTQLSFSSLHCCPNLESDSAPIHSEEFAFDDHFAAEWTLDLSIRRWIVQLSQYADLFTDENLSFKRHQVHLGWSCNWSLQSVHRRYSPLLPPIHYRFLLDFLLGCGNYYLKQDVCVTSPGNYCQMLPVIFNVLSHILMWC